jgi:hypothetical protein
MTRRRHRRSKTQKGGGTSNSSVTSNSSGTSSNSSGDNSTTRKKTVKAQCAPKPKDANGNDKLNELTCYSKPSLIKMRDLWNVRHKDKKIVANDPKEIWNKLNAAMSSACEAESCWLNQEFIKHDLDSELLNYTFAPKSPPKWKTDHNTWLNSLDIEKVMKQYEHSYPDFRFIGPTPIDFDKHTSGNTCVWDDLCNFDLAKYRDKGVNKIGIIFNTDPHNKGGSHWIAMFINIQAGFMFYFDSNGYAEKREIKKFVERIMTQTKTMTPPVKLEFMNNAPLRHQEGNTECGMYSLFFIISLLKETKPYTFFQKTKITDKDMEHLRDVYFNST